MRKMVEVPREESEKIPNISSDGPLTVGQILSVALPDYEMIVGGCGLIEWGFDSCMTCKGYFVHDGKVYIIFRGNGANANQYSHELIHPKTMNVHVIGKKRGSINPIEDLKQLDPTMPVYAAVVGPETYSLRATMAVLKVTEAGPQIWTYWTAEYLLSTYPCITDP